MGLDVYVGPLWRLWTGEWQTAAQQWGVSLNHDVRIIHPELDTWPDDSSVAPGAEMLVVETKTHRRTLDVPDAMAAQEKVEDWQGRFVDTLQRAGVGNRFRWSETADTPYQTDKLGWPGMASLMLWAAYEQRGLEPPATLPSPWQDDSCLRDCHRSLPEARYRQLLAFVEIWLPGEPVQKTFQASNPMGQLMDFGFLAPLVDELHELNRRTWGATEDDIKRWLLEPADWEGPLEANAQFGLAVLLELTQFGVRNGLPLALDF